MRIAMLKLALLLMWNSWSTFWNLLLLSKNIVYQSLLGFRRTGATPRDVENVEQRGDTREQPSNVGSPEEIIWRMKC